MIMTFASSRYTGAADADMLMLASFGSSAGDDDGDGGGDDNGDGGGNDDGDGGGVV